MDPARPGAASAAPLPAPLKRRRLSLRPRDQPTRPSAARRGAAERAAEQPAREERG